MSIVTTFVFTSDTETVTDVKLNNLIANLLTEFNGNIDNANIKATANIASSKLNLSNITQDITFTGTLDMSSASVTLPTISNVNIDSGTFLGSTTFSGSVTFAGQTIADLGSVTTCNINGGTINGVTSLGMSTGADITEFSTDGTLADNSDSAVPTEKAVKTYIDNNSSNTDVYTSDGTWTAPTGVTRVYITMVGAGGGGGAYSSSEGSGGGGGAGAFTTEQPVSVTPGNNYTVTVGTGGTGSSTVDTGGSSGGNSTFQGDDFTITCGGGSGGASTAGGGAGGAGGSISGVGNNTPSTPSSVTGASGGGAGINNATIGDGATGGAGAGNNLGGGGGAGSLFAAGGNGGTRTGNGEGDPPSNGSNGSLGSGGGGGADDGGYGGNGGDGIVIIRYK